MYLGTGCGCFVKKYPVFWRAGGELRRVINCKDKQRLLGLKIPLSVRDPMLSEVSGLLIPAGNDFWKPNRSLGGRSFTERLASTHCRQEEAPSARGARLLRACARWNGSGGRDTLAAAWKRPGFADPNPSPFPDLRLPTVFLRAGKVEKQLLWAGNLQRDAEHPLSIETKSVSLAVTLFLPASRALGTSWPGRLNNNRG